MSVKDAFPSSMIPEMKRIENRINSKITDVLTEAKLIVMEMFDLDENEIDYPEYEPYIQDEIVRIVRTMKEQRKKG